MVDSNETNSITAELKKNNIKNIFSRIKRRALKHYKLIRLLLVGGLILIVFLVFQFFNFLLNKTQFSIYKDIAKAYVVSPTEKLSSFEDRVNILILGKGGITHTAGDLTDTMLLVSLNLKNGNIFMISLPRDIWISTLRAKLNSAYYWGNQKAKGGGFILAKSEVEKIVGVPVNYAVVFDFGTFKDVIDVLGGIDVDVQNSFVDNRFPIPGLENDLCNGDRTYACRYETLTFEKGVRHMDGTTALKFVRSRNAEGDEGTDIAREARQQQVIAAVRKKLQDPKIFLNISLMKKLFSVVSSSIETDLSPQDMAILASKIKRDSKTESEVIPEQFLINPPTSKTYDNQYVFIPSAKPTKVGEENWSELQSWIKEKLNEN